MPRKQREGWQLLGAHLEVELVKALRMKLVEDELTYTDWLKREIRGYISKRAKRRGRREKRK